MTLLSKRLDAYARRRRREIRLRSARERLNQSAMMHMLRHDDISTWPVGAIESCVDEVDSLADAINDHIEQREPPIDDDVTLIFQMPACNADEFHVDEFIGVQIDVDGQYLSRIYRISERVGSMDSLTFYSREEFDAFCEFYRRNASTRYGEPEAVCKPDTTEGDS